MPLRERLAKIGGCLLVAVLVATRILQLPRWPGYIREVQGLQPWFARLAFLPHALLPPAFDLEAWYTGSGYGRREILTLWGLQLSLWILETGLLLGYAVVWLTRPAATSVAKGFRETVLPLLLVLFPFGIVMMPYTYNRWMPEKATAHLAGLYAINLLLILGGLLNIIGLVALRRSFAIMAEARVLVRSGPYRWVRHPMYSAHFVIFLCVLLQRFAPLTLGLYIVFVGGQIVRARIEERKLAATFPDYEEYRRTTGMFFPRLSGNAEIRS
ncbi:MAG TPA: isoprenylcysteine carboxylmethyltransferase family protein [Planctomycetota bacterium]|jgi:protein-S-isoprenylcysteine O-methyltransferase Ste14|nr:isoprenylcysteine carboxylmethyltransferase family protein [Planctomycetota bacterium]